MQSSAPAIQALKADWKADWKVDWKVDWKAD